MQRVLHILRDYESSVSNAGVLAGEEAVEPHYVVKRAIKTEKSVNDTSENNKYHFEVHRDATKYQIREAIQALFPDVSVVDINTTWARGKRRRHRWVRGKRHSWKKAIVTLSEGDMINVGY